MIEKIFNINKKPHMYKIDEDMNITILGKSEFNENSWCELSLMFMIIKNNENLEPIVIKKYRNRSLKFKSGDFTVQDAQRYIKSRYRDVIRHINRQQSGIDVFQVLKEYENKFLLEQ